MRRISPYIIPFLTAIFFIIQSYCISKNFIFRNSIDHHEVEYFSVVNNIQIQTPNVDSRTIYRNDGENILDPGGHIQILKAYNFILKILNLNYNSTYHPILYLRILSCFVLLIIAVIFSLIAYEISRNIAFSVTCLFVPYLSTVLSLYGFIARAFIFEALFTVSSIYFLIKFLKKQNPISFILMLSSILFCMWIRYSGSFITSFSLIIFLYISIDKILNKKYFYYTISAIGINVLFILSQNWDNIILIKTKTLHLANDYLLNNILELNYRLFFEKFLSQSFIFQVFIVSLFLLKKKSLQLNLPTTLYFTTFVLYLMSSFLGLYPFNLSERHSISLHITFLVFFIYEASELLRTLVPYYKSFILYTLLISLYCTFQFENHFLTTWNSKMCQIDIKTRNDIIMKYQNKIFSAGAWAEEWYQLNYGNLKEFPNKKTFYANTKVIPSEFIFDTPLEKNAIYISQENSEVLNNKALFNSKNISFIMNYPSCTVFREKTSI
jgi:hypothetical protein